MKETTDKLRLCLATLLIGMLPLANAVEIVVVEGAEGAEEYRKIFSEQVSKWKDAAKAGGAEFRKLSTREEVEKLLTEENEEELWLVLIGHGTFDGRVAKFNVEGPDFSDSELAQWAKNTQRPLVVMNMASASAPFLNALSGEDRILITATKSSSEIFYTRFGEYFADAIGGLSEADLDNDLQVSLLEAYLYSATQVTGFYEKEGRLATEHALIDDNGDKKGTRADWFEGVRATKVATKDAEPDGERAHQRVLVLNKTEAGMPPELRKKRDELELQVKSLVRKKADLEEDDYYQQLEPLLKEIAEIYRKAEPETSPKSNSTKTGTDSIPPSKDKPATNAPKKSNGKSS